jgi:ABC-type Fe3+/spermidine/putrescine transport system ATPase subunit
MLDEPLGALDRALRTELLQELRHLLHTSQIPAIYVTHDQEEAFSIADRLILLHEGHLVQEGAPDEVYLHPVNAWVAHFLGMDNLLPGMVVDAGGQRTHTQLGEFVTSEKVCQPLAAGEAVQLLLRPGGLRLSPVDGGVNHFRGFVEDVLFQGAMYEVVIRSAGGLRFHFTVDQPLVSGKEMDLYLVPDSISCLR